MGKVQWPRELNVLQMKKKTRKLRKHLHRFDNTDAVNTHNGTKYRNMLQILTAQNNTEKCCKNLQRNQIQKHAANMHRAHRKCLRELQQVTNMTGTCLSMSTLKTEKHYVSVTVLLGQPLPCVELHNGDPTRGNKDFITWRISQFHSMSP